MRLLLVVLVLITVECGAALPRFALMTGSKCGSCHVNPAGGQMRNDFGIGFSQDKLPLEALKDSEFNFSHKLNDNISVGADYRGQIIYDFSTSPDYTNPIVDPVTQQTTFPSTTGKSTFHAMTASIYGTVSLSKKLTFYFKQDLLHPRYENLGGPEVFLLAKVLPGGFYVKGGEFLPDYGWRIDDHTSYIRGGDLAYLPGLPVQEGLIFHPNYKDVGLEVGGYAGSLLMTAGLFNGSGNTVSLNFTQDKAYVGRLEQMGTISTMNYRLGVSGYGFRSYKMGGVNAGVGTDDFTILGEMDWTHGAINVTMRSVPVNEHVNTMAAYAELDIRAMQGLWLTGKFDMFDPLQGVSDDDSSAVTNSVKRLTFGLELFPWSFIEVRPQYRLNIETPSVSNDQLLVQMHVWY